MSIIKYSFNRQLHILSQSTAYLAFGFTPQSNMHPNTQNDYNPFNQRTKTSQFVPLFRSDIARRLYDQYQAEGFKYADHGITPKAIARQIEIHIKKKNNIFWTIDEFGNFIFQPNPIFLAQIHRNLLSTTQYSHTILQQFYPFSTKIPQSIHYFDFYLSHHPTLQQFQKFAYLESKAKVFELLNHHIIRRTIFVDQISQQTQDKLTSICNLLLKKDSFEVLPYTSLYTLNRKGTTREEQIYQYFGCDGQNTVHYRKNLPDHILQNKFLGSQLQRVEEIKKQELIKKLSQMFKRKEDKLQDKQRLVKLSLQECIVVYGNLIDEHKFEKITELFQLMEYWDLKDTTVYKILRQSFQKIIHIPLFI